MVENFTVNYDMVNSYVNGKNMDLTVIPSSTVVQNDSDAHCHEAAMPFGHQ